MARDWMFFLGGVAVGVAGTLLVTKREKVKPLAANLLAKAMTLKEKTMTCLEKTKEHAEDIVAEARHINDQKAAEPEQPAAE